MTEVWKPVVGYEGRYEVSSEGRVRSLTYRSNGGLCVMKTTPNYAGYHVVTLGKERRQYRVHCLVLEAFVGPRPEGLQGCHGDNNRENNRLDNLRWDTPKGNIADRECYEGERNPNAKLTQADWLNIKRRYLGGEKSRVLADEFGVTQARITQIARNPAV